MNAVRQIVDGNELSQVVKLPRHLRDKKVEIIVFPVPDEEDKPFRTTTRSQLEAMLPGSRTEAMSGALSAAGDIDLAQIRAERLAKYENPS